ncbi:anti-phage-associated DUF1156 domain-containing protein [Methylococcus geothermalis]|uniref:DUF1156 domain-containing protein n=1 Tax=Methylococcus geothermalis TaxID=2681310 RepID=A0A858Q3Z7_9GAMM|nr:anti-phage-associated DUF1156 domain-containing protein [Methylococcus geothermalis]QJD28557.1 DUF1156 domain-containing protein [Methylococcus geothermalis]
MHAKTTTTTLTPLALKDAPALIETVFPAQKVSFEAQSERKAGAGQTLTGLGSYWKGRKPLILVRAIVLGSLLPATGDAEADLAIFEKLMAFDDEGLARRALAANAFSASKLQALIPIADPERYFRGRGWRRDLTDDDKLVLYRQALTTLSSYEEKASLGKRPEEVDQDWLYAPVWPEVNRHYAHLGVNAQSLPELVEQLGILRYGHRPRVGDTFCGGGSIPFEAARIGCDAYASDLNPIACMLTWGAFHIVGGSKEEREQLKRDQQALVKKVLAEIDRLGIETDGQGWRAKVFLYCVEVRCPQTGWMVPLLPTLVVSKGYKVTAELVPDPGRKRYDIAIRSDVSDAELKAAELGTVRSDGRGQDPYMVHTVDGREYRTKISTLRGDYKKPDGTTGNQLRLWEKHDFKPRPEDIFQERLYCIQWMRPRDSGKSYDYEFRAVTEEDLERERIVEEYVAKHLAEWQEQGWVPDMRIEPGDKTDEPIRTRGWTHWHHLFNPRQLLLGALMRKQASAFHAFSIFATLDLNSRLSRWNGSGSKGAGGNTSNTFDNQALNTLFNYGHRGVANLQGYLRPNFPIDSLSNAIEKSINCRAADELSSVHPLIPLFITDPPYADAVKYEEITEFFIAWLRKNPPPEFAHWVWDSRRALAIKGEDEDFRRGMVAAYTAMAEHMPDNGMQCVMFTHQDTSVWGDLIGIFWAAGLQVVAAWYIATETTSELKKGGYVQGTVILMLKKRAAGERTGFKQRLLPAVRQEVARQIETMMHLNDTVKTQHGEPVWSDADLQMAGYAAALKVLTAYTHIGGEDVTRYALRPRVRGEVTVVDEIVQQAAETASSLLVPEELSAETWAKLTGIERFVLRMLDMKTTGSTKLDNYQNFAKAFRVTDYSRVMGDMRPNHARLKRISEFASRDLTEATEIGATRLGRLIIALQQRLKDAEPQVIVDQLRGEMADFLEVRPLLVDMLAFIERNSPEPEVRTAAEVLGARLKNLRFGE